MFIGNGDALLSAADSIVGAFVDSTAIKEIKQAKSAEQLIDFINNNDKSSEPVNIAAMQKKISELRNKNKPDTAQPDKEGGKAAYAEEQKLKYLSYLLEIEQQANKINKNLNDDIVLDSTLHEQEQELHAFVTNL